MSYHQLWRKTEPLEGVLGAHIEVRCRWTKRGWTAYRVETGCLGGIKSVHPLKTKGGRLVQSWDGMGDLTEKINELIARKEIQ
jgi:hypothetical protein